MSGSDSFERSPYSGKFLFEVDGVEIGTFTEVSGLELDVGVEELEEGGQNQFVHKLPGRMTWPNLVLKRGMTKGDELFAWVRKSSGDGFAGEGSKIERKSAAVTLINDKGDRMRAWELDGAFPVRWRGPSFVASSNDLAAEELEIAHHGFRSAKV